MSDIDQIELLREQLEAQITENAKKRAEEAAAFEREMAQRNDLAELERRERLEFFKKREEEFAAKKAKEAEEAEKRKQEERAKQAQLEQQVYMADKARVEYEERVELLKKAIIDQEFVEEQHRKSMQRKTITPTVLTSPTEINVEHPVAPVNASEPGACVEGTSGKTPDTPLMSDHLKQILRQATRQY